MCRTRKCSTPAAGPESMRRNSSTAARGSRAFDVTPAFVELARNALGESAEVFRWNLEEPLRFAADRSFDAVVCALVLDYIEDWAPAMAEVRRVLRPGGRLVFSCGHPWADWQLTIERGVANGSYFDRAQYTLPWRRLRALPGSDGMAPPAGRDAGRGPRWRPAARQGDRATANRALPPGRPGAL
ncbi:MAG: class I SAM-dependent methyltransferase [Dehalococcoidia bacterium]|nr:class I SAM-dependent methyltransferase [Dehalococcoidia bacterium]